MKSNLSLVLIAAIAPLAMADERLLLSPDIPYRAERSSPVEYDVELVVAVTAPYKTRQLSVWLPIPPSDHGQELLSSEVSSFPEDAQPRIASEPTFGNKFAYFEFAQPQGAQIIRHRFRVRAYELRWNLDPGRIAQVEKWPEAFEKYLRSEGQAVVSDERFTRLLSELVPARSGPLDDLGRVMGWVHDNFNYDHADASLQASSIHALEKRRGHCSDYHGFCAAMGRVLGQPTRVTYGLNAFPKSSPSHCKLEAFLPPYGWVSFDVSETQKLYKSIRETTPDDAQRQRLLDAAQRRLLSGFRDNTWFVQTRGTDYDLAPKASRRVAVVRTIYAEADGKPLPEPDPSSAAEARFAWMTAHRFSSNVKVPYPFADTATLKEWVTAGTKPGPGVRPQESRQ